MIEVFELLIIGGGAAGLMAAASAKKITTLVIDKNGSAGKKVMISGKGQCNFTHDESANEMSEHFGSHKNFVKHALGKWSPEMTRLWFKERGVDSFVMENGKVFPKSLNAGDIVEALMNEALNNGVTFHFKETVLSVEHNGDFLIKTDQKTYRAKNVIIATGGFTYGVTGSTGDGYAFAKELGHHIVAPKAALAPIYHKVEVLKALSGASIQNAEVTLVRENKTLKTYSGDLLFTHKGLSGPVILNNSRDFSSGDVLKLNFTTFTKQALETELINLSQSKGKNNLRHYMRQICHSKSMADQLALLLKVDESLTFAEMNKELRQGVVKTLTEFSVTIEQVGGKKIGMATAGGVDLTEVKGKSMASKLCEGLYFAGEVLDVDGDTGGYNIQWAFSSAVCAIAHIHENRN